jgi:hypothetical protein
LFNLFSDPEDEGNLFIRNIDWLHGVVHRKIELFLSIAVRTSIPTTIYSLNLKYNFMGFILPLILTDFADKTTHKVLLKTVPVPQADYYEV